MTEAEAPSIIFRDLRGANYFAENQTYDVSQLTYGMFFEVLKQLEMDLNFTTSLYKVCVPQEGPQEYLLVCFQLLNFETKESR